MKRGTVSLGTGVKLLRLALVISVLVGGFGLLVSSAAANGAPASPTTTPGELKVSLTNGMGTANATWAVNTATQTVNVTNGSATNVAVASLNGNLNDTAKAINFAISNATVTNDTVVVGDGFFNGTVNVANSAVSDLDNSENATGIDAVGNPKGINVTASSLNITGFNIVGNSSFTFTGAFGGIILDSATDVNLTGNFVQGNVVGITAAGSSNSQITDNAAITNLLGIAISSSSNNYIADNDAVNNDFGFALEQSSDNNNVTGNTAVDNTNDGIRVLSSSNNNNVTDNTFTSGSESGIEVKNANGNLLRNNTVSNFDTNGIFADSSTDVTMVNNTITDVGGSGVSLNGSTAVLTNTTVRRAASVFEAVNGGVATAAGFDIGPSANPGTVLDFEARDVRLKNETAPPADPGDPRTGLGTYFNATEMSAGGYLNLTVEYDSTAGTKEGTVDLYRFDGTVGEWGTVNGSRVDTAANIITANLTTFSVFGVFAEGYLNRREVGRGQEDIQRDRSRDLGRGEPRKRDDLRHESGRNRNSNRRDRGRGR